MLPHMADEQSASLNHMAPRTREGTIQVWYLLPASTSKRLVQNTIARYLIFIPTLKPLAQGGVCFSNFHAPPFADFRTYFLSAIDFGAPLTHLARLPSFSNFKLVCPLCPPRLHHASTAPAPRPRPNPTAPEFDRLKSL